jgi:hypothetical protein
MSARRLSTLAFLLVTLAVGARAATAQTRRGWGLGAEAMLSGPAGPVVVYDAGSFRIDGVFGFASNGKSTVAAGGRFAFVLHSASAADFAVGGGLGIVDVEDTTELHVEGFGQIRAFIVENVALSAAFGLAVGAADADFIAVTGQLAGSVGIAYYFD